LTDLAPPNPTGNPPRAMRSTSPDTMPIQEDEEAALGLLSSRSRRILSPGLYSPSHGSLRSHLSDAPVSPMSRFYSRPMIKRRPTAVRVPERYRDKTAEPAGEMYRETSVTLKRRRRPNERTPLIKAGVKPDVRKSVDDAQATMNVMRRAEVGLGRMVELGLPLIMYRPQ